jgi:hypothetical protein
MGSPTRTPILAMSLLLEAPTSTQRLLVFDALPRSSWSMRWIAFFPMTPVTAPEPVRMLTLCPTSTCGSQPPISATYRYPSASMCVTCSPISSMWPASITRGDPPGLVVANELPFTSTRTSCANFSASSRQTRAARTSKPEGPAASRRRSRKAISLLMREAIRAAGGGPSGAWDPGLPGRAGRRQVGRGGVRAGQASSRIGSERWTASESEGSARD